MNNFLARIYGGAILFLVCLISIWTATWEGYSLIFFSVASSAICLAAWELEQMTKQVTELKGLPWSVLAAFLYLAAYFGYLRGMLPVSVSYLVLWSFLLLICLYHFVSERRPLVAIALCLLPMGYLVLPLATLFDIAYLPLASPLDGRFWLAYLLLVVKSSDMAAYFVGKLWGRWQIAAYISPKKTWEGAMGGIVAGPLVGWGWMAAVVQSHGGIIAPVSWPFLLALGMVLAIVAILGDLTESLFKRDAGCKDSNSVLPGMGGLLDLLDSLVFAAPLLYIGLSLFM